MRKQLIFLMLLIVIIAPVAFAATWGSLQELESITILASELSTTATTWHPLQSVYDLDQTVIIGIAPSVVFNTSAVEQKFVIKIAGSDTNYHLDLAFFANGALDIVETTPSGSTKIGGVDSSDTDHVWTKFSYILVYIEGTKVTVKGDDGTILATVTWSSAPTSIAQIGASGADYAVTSGQVVVAILYDPYLAAQQSTQELFTAMIPLIGTMLSLAIVFGALSMMAKVMKKIFK